MRRSTTSSQVPSILLPSVAPIMRFSDATTILPRLATSSFDLPRAGSMTSRMRRFSTTSNMSTSPWGVMKTWPYTSASEPMILVNCISRKPWQSHVVCACLWPFSGW